MAKVLIVTHAFIDIKSLQPEVGGVQTYCVYLIDALIRAGHQLKILQEGARDCSIPLEPGLDVNVVRSSGIAAAVKTMSEEVDFTIFASAPMSVLPHKRPSVAIQHGVSKDGSRIVSDNFTIQTLRRAKAAYEVFQYHRMLRAIPDLNDLVICVDTNYINFLRASFPLDGLGGNMVYIPNFASVMSEDEVSRKLEAPATDTVTFICPRRFIVARGGAEWARAAVKVHAAYPQARFRFLGRGEEENHIRTILKDVPTAEVSIVDHSKMGQEYAEADVVVVPTLWSEGTSLSAIEGMAHGCALITSNVGGLGNIVIPDYNGIIVNPDPDELAKAAIRLIRNPEHRKLIARRGYEVTRNALTREHWETRVLTALGPYLA